MYILVYKHSYYSYWYITLDYLPDLPYPNMAYLIAIAAGSLFASVLGQPTPAPAPGDECIKALTPICDPDYFGQTGLEFLTEGINGKSPIVYCNLRQGFLFLQEFL